MKKKIFYIAGIMIPALLLLSDCAPAAAEPEEIAPPAETPEEAMESDEEAEEKAPPAGTPEVDVEEEGAIMEEMDPSVDMSDQAIENSMVAVDMVYSSGPGWIVIHGDDGGSLGQVVGHVAVQDGENTDVMVKVDEAAATDTLYAMLYLDAGEGLIS